MRNIIFVRPILVALALVFTLAAGCGGGDGVTVSGSVTYDGNPVEKGYINFYPSDGKGRPAGGEIIAGKYTVKNVAPGKNRVEVTATPQTQVSDSMGEPVKDSKGKIKKEQPPKEPTKDTIAANAEGNNQTHEIASGAELNLVIHAASSTSGPLKK
jgi:hypothetical protein